MAKKILKKTKSPQKYFAFRSGSVLFVHPVMTISKTILPYIYLYNLEKRFRWLFFHRFYVGQLTNWHSNFLRTTYALLKYFLELRVLRPHVLKSTTGRKGHAKYWTNKRPKRPQTSVFLLHMETVSSVFNTFFLWIFFFVWGILLQKRAQTVIKLFLQKF